MAIDPGGIGVCAECGADRFVFDARGTVCLACGHRGVPKLLSEADLRAANPVLSAPPELWPPRPTE